MPPLAAHRDAELARSRISMLWKKLDGAGASAGKRLPLPLIVLLVLGLSALFAWNVARTWSLGDDAFISFRYARNLADGLGLCWNAGERVEGYTNFAWVLLMAAGMRLGLEPEQLANVIGVACGAALLVALFRFAARGRERSPWPWLLVALLASSRSFTAWCTGGLETMLFTLLVFLGFARVIAPWRGRDALACSLCFALAGLTRPEGLLFAFLAFLVLLVDVVGRRRSARAVLAWLAPFVLVVGAHFAWRRVYYGEWLPNTFHAKVSGLWLEQGWRYFAYYHDCYRIGWFLLLAPAAFFGPNRRAVAVVMFVLVAYGAYVLAVGGDFFELRFCVHVFPLLYWLLVEGLAGLASFGVRRERAVLRGVATVAALVLLVTTWSGYDRVPAKLFGVQSVPSIARYAEQRMAEGRILRERIEANVLPRELVLAAGGAGAVPYYTRWTTVDRRGLNDVYIARLPVERRGLVGHEHEAPYDYLVERRVAVFDVFNQLLVKERALPQLVKPQVHEGRRLEMRAVRLGERALVFATFLGDEELARLFEGLTVVELSGS